MCGRERQVFHGSIAQFIRSLAPVRKRQWSGYRQTCETDKLGMSRHRQLACRGTGCRCHQKIEYVMNIAGKENRVIGKDKILLRRGVWIVAAHKDFYRHSVDIGHAVVGGSSVGIAHQCGVSARLLEEADPELAWNVRFDPESCPNAGMLLGMFST